MAIFLRIVRSNSLVPEEREFLVQVSQDATPGSWNKASVWYPTREEAEQRVAQILEGATRGARRRTFSIVASYSGET